MPVVKNIIDFSSDGEYLAYSSPDGCLKIWETSTNNLIQEYTPSSHLSATCSAISWCPNKNAAHSLRRHKKVKVDEDFSAIRDLQLIAMGTLTGQILLYSYKKADLYSCLNNFGQGICVAEHHKVFCFEEYNITKTNGHTGIVNDVCWCTSTSSIFSCSDDKNIIIWDVFTGKVKTKWKGDNNAVYSICIIDSNQLLSASNSIKLWNIEQKTVIKTFIGHASDIFRLIPLKSDEETHNSYFISAAVGDRVINAWQLNAENKRAVAAFVVTDEPESISVFAEDNKPMLLCVVCKDGSLHLFEHVLNGHKKKPIRSKLCIQIASKGSDSQSKPEKVPILCASLSLDISSSLITYGSFLKPTFERIDFTTEEYKNVSNVFLVRDTSISSAVSQEESVTRVKHTDKSEKVKVLAPGHLTPGKGANNSLRKRKKKELFEQELPMEERLRALDLSRIPPNLEEQDSILKADSMVHLLLQGLQSKDNSMINTVLQSNDERIIQNTIKRLPLQSIILLLKELHTRLSRKEQIGHPYVKWMKCLLSAHLPYLMSCKDIGEYLGPINQIIQARIENFSKMCQLHGCLKILLSQTTTRKSEKNEVDKPLAVYQSDSSEGESDAEENDSDGMESSESSDGEQQTDDDSLQEGSSTSSSESDEEKMVL